MSKVPGTLQDVSNAKLKLIKKGRGTSAQFANIHPTSGQKVGTGFDIFTLENMFVMNCTKPNYSDSEYWRTALIHLELLQLCFKIWRSAK